MKIILFVISVLALARAELEIFIDEKPIQIEDESILQNLDITQFTVTKGENVAIFVNDTVTKNAIDDKIIDWLEEVREQLSVGFPELGIPPLDPIKKDIVSFKFVQPYLFKSTLSLKDISVTGLQKFITEKIKFKVLGLTFEFGIDVPTFQYESDFGVKGRITIVIPFQFGGGVRLKLKHLRVSGKASLGTTSTGHLKLRSLTLDFSVQKTSLHFSGIIGNGPLNAIVNWIMNLFTNGVIKDQVASLGDKLGDELFYLLNEVLGNIKLSDIVG